VTPLPTAPPDDTGWTSLDLPPIAEVARLEATRTGTSSVAPDTAFRLTSLDGTPARDLASRLVSFPAVRLAVARVSGSTAVLQPAAPLQRGQVYRFELRRPDGTTSAAWAVQAASPLHVASTIPGDSSTDVPRDTGIEIAFDQEGVRLADLRSHFSIRPAIDGRFQVHGRTWAFVPANPLKSDTLYTVTVSHGLPLAGTGLSLEQDEVIRFETGGSKASSIHVSFARVLFDASPREKPAVSLRFDSSDETPEKVRDVAVVVHRLGGLPAAMNAFRLIDGAPDWTERSSTVPVATAGLPLAASATLRVRALADDGTMGWVQLPRRLAAGWYVVTVRHAGVSRQAVLQVTDLSAFTMISTTRSLVWVNDLRTNAPVMGARVTLAGRGFGRTDAEGLRTAPSPTSLVKDAREGTQRFAVIRSGSRSVFVPMDAGDYCGKCAGGEDDDWWHLLTTDRARYRVSDTVNVWGVVRNRDRGTIPGSIVVRMSASYSNGPIAPVLAHATVTPDATGSYLAHLSFTDLPPGEYPIQVSVGKDTLAETWIEVGPISKPAWKLDLTSARHAVLTDTAVSVTAAASFYEGTPVAGAALTLSTADQESDTPSPADSTAHVTTDANGGASGSVTPHIGNDAGQWTWLDVSAQPDEPEEGAISAQLPVAVFRSTAVLEAHPVLRRSSLTVTGSVNDVAFARFEDPAALGAWDIDPRGAPRAGATVRLHVTEHIPTLHRTGTRYDFIAKRAVPVYRETDRLVDRGIHTVKTGIDGTYRIRLTVNSGPDHSYDVMASYADEAGRTIEADETAYAATSAFDRTPHLVDVQGPEGTSTYHVGDAVRVRFQGGITAPEVQRFLFVVAARGIRTASVQAGPGFSTRFAARLVPDASVTAVRFTGTGYEPVMDGYDAQIRQEDRKLDISLTPDRDHYAPGGRATVAVRTLDARGHPASATVFVRAVDEKLFDVGGASVDDPLGTLYQGPGSGLLAVGWSHADLESNGGDGGGDTTGGGGDDRSEFRDWLTAQLVTTGADGRGTISFDLSDDLTSWRVLASGVSRSLDAGQATVSLPVSLPFFADAIVAPEYLSVDRPVIRVRAYGTALTASDDVTFTVSSDTLSMAPVSVHATAFQPAEVALPALAPGTHRIRVAATSSTGGVLRDALVRTFRVVDSRSTRHHTSSVALTAGAAVSGADGITTVTLVDSGRGRVVPALRELAASDPFRADSALAAAIARDALVHQFGIADDPSLPAVDLNPFQGGGGISLLPYASADLELAAMAAFSGDRHVDRAQLAAFVSNEDESGLSTDQALYLLLAKASLGQASIGDVTTAASRTDLTPPQRVTVALAAVAVGDMSMARSIERGVLAAHGERLGPWVRVKGSTLEETAVMTGRLAIVAAALGDPLAAGMDAEITAHPPQDTLLDLERALAGSWWAKVTPRADAAASLTLDGKTTRVAITAGQPVVLRVTPAQRAGLRIDPVSGSVLVVSDWEGPVAAGDLTPASGETITRTVAPAGTIGATKTVTVTFQVKLGAAVDDGCTRVTDLAPSGLAPISANQVWDGEEDPESDTTSVIGPWQVVGQRVEFCVTPDPNLPVQTLRYLARVVTPGTYRWEPAVLQSSVASEQGIVLPAFDVTIGGLGS
jgi:hypothetical protein